MLCISRNEGADLRGRCQHIRYIPGLISCDIIEPASDALSGRGIALLAIHIGIRFAAVEEDAVDAVDAVNDCWSV